MFDMFLGNSSVERIEEYGLSISSSYTSVSSFYSNLMTLLDLILKFTGRELEAHSLVMEDGVESGKEKQEEKEHGLRRLPRPLLYSLPSFLS